MQNKKDPDVNNDEWLRGRPAHLEFMQHCMKQVLPSTDGFLERIIRFVHARGNILTRELHETLEQLKTPVGKAAFVLLDETQTTRSFKNMGVSLDPKGFNAATYTVPGRSVFYGVKGKDQCVLEIKTVSASLEPLLSWGGWSVKAYEAADQRQNDVIFARKFKEADSINIRILEGTWRDDKFTGSFVMRGNYGVDSHQLSRLDVEQEYGRMRVVMGPAKDQDWKRLGMDSATSEWPASESVHFETVMVMGAIFEPNQQAHWVSSWRKKLFENPVVMTPQLWPYNYLTDNAKKQIPGTMYTVSPSSPTAVDKDYAVSFAAIPKNYRIPTSVDLLVMAFFGARQSLNRSPHKDERAKGYQSLILLPPKPNEGSAKGLATYRLEGEPNGVRKAYELIIKTKGALPDDKLDSFAQMRLLPTEAVKPSKAASGKGAGNAEHR